MKKSNKTTYLLPFGLLVLFLASCLDNDIDSYKTTERQDIREYIEGKGFTDIGGYGIYVKFYNRDNVEALEDNIKDGEAFLMNYDAEYLTGELWETSDSVKGGKNFPDLVKVYGPAQFRAGNISMFGLDTAIKYFSAGDTGTIVIPSWYGWYDATRVFHVGVKAVIENDSVYSANTLSEFLTNNNFSLDKELYNGVFYKNVSYPDSSLSDTTIHELGDTVSLNITGRYAENYYPNHKGRFFYPLGSESKLDTIIIGDHADYPYRDAIDSVLMRMKVGETIEIVTSHSNGWGESGYFDKTSNVNLVPKYKPLHFTVELLGVKDR